MLTLNLWNYFRGYVIIKIEGLALEKFVNMCIVRDIYLWDIERVNYTTLEAKVGIKAFKTTCKIARRAGCKIRISKKNGYPFWLSRMKKRKMLIFGAFFSLTLLLALSSFVFTIDVVGNERVSEEEIIEGLGEVGFTIGKNRYLINIREIENELLINLQELAWVGIEINGINAKIEVVEKVTPPSGIQKDVPCDVVAKKSGVIEKIIARNGDTMVQKGDIVSSGDLLITGIIEREGLEQPLYHHAYGEVYAKTYYETSKTVDLIRRTKEKTGEKMTRNIIKVGDIEISLGTGDNPYEVYIIEKSSKKPFQWRNKGLPVEIITEEIYEAVEIEEKLDIEEEKNKLHDVLIKELMEDIPEEMEVLNSNTEFFVDNDNLEGRVILEVLEDIAQQREIEYEKIEYKEMEYENTEYEED